MSSKPSLLRQDITGLVLAGGEGRRMNGEDKGLLEAHGRPLVQWTLERLASQVGSLGISANRHLERYRSLGVPVWSDTAPGFNGPLAGIAAAMAQCQTPYLVVVPCDTPCFPSNLVARLAQTLIREGAELVMAATPAPDTGAPLAQPVFCLLHTALQPSLQRFLAQGDRKVGLWMRQQRHALALFDETDAFTGANTPEEWKALSQRLIPLAGPA